MDYEIINSVEVTEGNELFLGLEGEGSPSYQYIYREAAGVYWDPQKHGFRSTELKDWGHAKWFSHIISVVRSIGIELRLSDDATWSDIPSSEKATIISEHNTV